MTDSFPRLGVIDLSKSCVAPAPLVALLISLIVLMLSSCAFEQFIPRKRPLYYGKHQ